MDNPEMELTFNAECVKLTFKWKKKTGLYSQGENLYLGTILVASYSWNSARSTQGKDDSTRYVGNIRLPSLKDDVGKQVYASNPDEIKPKIEQAVERWFVEALRENHKEVKLNGRRS